MNIENGHEQTMENIGTWKKISANYYSKVCQYSWGAPPLTLYISQGLLILMISHDMPWVSHQHPAILGMQAAAKKDAGGKAESSSKAWQEGDELEVWWVWHGLVILGYFDIFWICLAMMFFNIIIRLHSLRLIPEEEQKCIKGCVLSWRAPPREYTFIMNGHGFRNRAGSCIRQQSCGASCCFEGLKIHQYHPILTIPTYISLYSL